MQDDTRQPEAASSALPVPASNGAASGGASAPVTLDPWKIDLSKDNDPQRGEVIMPSGEHYPVCPLDDMNIATYEETYDLYARALTLDETVRKLKGWEILPRIKADREAHGVLREMIRRLVPSMPPTAIEGLVKKHLARVAVEAWFVAGGPLDLESPATPGVAASDTPLPTTPDSTERGGRTLSDGGPSPSVT